LQENKNKGAETQMKKFAAVGSMCLLLLSLLTPGSCLAAENPEVKAIGAVLMDYQTGRVLWGKNENMPMAMASTTKIMTCVLALESDKLDDVTTVSRQAAAAPEVKMGLTVGEKLKVSDLLYALMLESENDAAVAIAEAIGGSVEAFCAQMTKKAQSIGAVNTVFETPNGLDKGDHHSTAYDMALIARYALSNSAFVDITNTKNAVIKSSKRTYSFVNKNRLLHEYRGANGVKTGFTGKAGHCFVGAARRGDMELISVVLASGWGNAGKQGKWIDTKALLDYGFANFSYKELFEEGALAGSASVTRSRTDHVAFAFGQTLTLPMREDEMDNIQVDFHVPAETQAPIQKGDVLGEAEVTIGGQLYARVSVIAMESAERHDFKTSLESVAVTWLRLGTKKEIDLTFPEFLNLPAARMRRSARLWG
jgi:D-alanyl-D-alanine carboxypeptidase (penicillin-binding protein 5/6)